MSRNNPFNAITLDGDGIFRGVTLVLPTAQVRRMLPAGLELGEQNVTPSGTHPVILLFNDLFRAHMNIPSLLPSLTYHEHTIGIPYSYVTRGPVMRSSPGPYYYMPLLYLDNLTAILGGVSIWGFAKRLARFEAAEGRYTIQSNSNERRETELTYRATGALAPVSEFENFDPIRRMHDQPLISAVPLGMGPFFVASDFVKDWTATTMRPLETSVEVDLEYVLGYPPGRYPARGTSPGIDESVLGSYEFRAPWRLGMPYPPLPR
jgi:hypothetical protein